MMHTKFGQLIARTVLALALVSAQDVHGVRAGQTWTMASAYPADTVSGRAVASFAAALSRRTGGALKGATEFGFSGVEADLVEAVQDGSVQVAGVYSGSLTHLDPIFELPTLPFEVHSVDEARRLACLAEPAYRRALSRAGLHLLFISPWPPTGLWSRQPVMTVADIATLRIRTYDAASAEVLRALGAHAVVLPVRDVEPLLHIGGLDAVLSSGDGAVGRSLQADLSNFNAIHYAFPVSFVVVSQSRYEALPKKHRSQLDEAAADAEREQWTSLPARIRANYAQMQQAGVVVNTSIDAGLSVRLRKAGEARVEKWLSRAPPEEAGIMKAFLNQGAPVAQDRCPLNMLDASHGTRG
ncbi:C4-dicarboxylate ABC transporter substrate-binding protein [Trinickia symbiotica]|uniref:C4-dicarboxylate ABC transporter substrate-binding protein n=1 Tax=Trinickia symbiotica TaxID=863227 RepID=A0A2T3XKD6_9BURK|nr:TRAP transporter substrate-binding protein DctP [Trinickia symbiotica]PTB16998.1 C4-dicarboxylate ABC transporter substrate-binding protein [Trinickia symbiotica]